MFYSVSSFLANPQLNHLFMTGEGKAKPEEYNLPNSVDIEVLQDIVEWVKKN